jgi:Flp pilus assembly pilin Flp
MAIDRQGHTMVRNGMISKFLSCEQGATATEYAVMLALVLLVVFVAVAAVGTKVSDMYVDSEQGW